MPELFIQLLKEWGINNPKEKAELLLGLGFERDFLRGALESEKFQKGWKELFKKDLKELRVVAEYSKRRFGGAFAKKLFMKMANPGIQELRVKRRLSRVPGFADLKEANSIARKLFEKREKPGKIAPYFSTRLNTILTHHPLMLEEALIRDIWSGKLDMLRIQGVPKATINSWVKSKSSRFVRWIDGLNPASVNSIRRSLGRRGMAELAPVILSASLHGSIKAAPEKVEERLSALMEIGERLGRERGIQALKRNPTYLVRDPSHFDRFVSSKLKHGEGQTPRKRPQERRVHK